MAMTALTDRYAANLHGVLSCCDRFIVTGTLPGACCADNGVSIEHVNKSHIRKEDLVARVLAERGNAPGLVHVISAMESCKPWLDKSNGHVLLRVPTWAPFGLQFYCNGHSALARSRSREGIAPSTT